MNTLTGLPSLPKLFTARTEPRSFHHAAIERDNSKPEGLGKYFPSPLLMLAEEQGKINQRRESQYDKG